MTHICGCCEGIRRLTPLKIENRPGLSALRYRVGTYSSFMETMLADLSSSPSFEPPCTQASGQTPAASSGVQNGITVPSPLLGLRTRRSDDPAIALIDAWATVADVLTFYQERIANEGYLRTATERRSVLELARLVGYRLRPGVASSVYLAFTVAGDVPTEVPQGARSQSIPGTGEMPQSFETSNKIAARPEWSKIRPRTSRPQFIDEFNAGSLDALYFQGISTNLKPGDLLLLPAGKGYPRAVDSVKADMASSTTKVILQTSLTLEGVLSSLKQSVGGYLDLRSRCLDDSDCTVKAAVDILKGIIDAIDICKGNLSQDCAQKIRSILDLDGKGAIRNISDLIDKIEKGTADEGCNHAGEKGTRKEAWLKSIYDALRKHATELEELPGIESSGTIGALQFSSKASPLTSGLSLVMAPLLKPPSLQPPSSTQLDRPISRIFGPGSDMGPKMLAAMRPGLWDDLYIALANARVTQPPDLSSVPVLGIKASPYGHNAPKMVVTDNKGVVVDQREWPLNGSIRVTASLIPGRGTPFGIAVLGVKRGGKTYGATGDIPFDSQLGDGIKASIKAPDTSSSDYTITFKIPGLNDKKIVVTVISSQVISIAIASTESPVKVDVDGEVFDSVYFDNTLSREKGSHRAEVSRNVDRLFISDESLLPPEETDVLYLDGRYDSITPGSWIAIRRPKAGDPSTTADPMIFRAKRVRTVTRNDYGFSGDSTRIELAGANNGNWLEPKNDVDISVLRGTEVFAQSGSLDLADETIDPVDEPVCGDTIELDGVYDGLESGRWLIVSGERLDIAGTSGVTGSELVMIAGVSQDVEKVADPKNPGGVMDLPGDTNHTFVKLASSLSYIYRRDSLTIYGNVSDATQGESKSEVLGSGDAGKSLQSFTLHQSPLTYIPDSNPTGIKSTLQVRVNDLLWQEVETLAGMGPRDRCYVTLTGDDAKTTIIFGNGARGARPPTGTENIRAAYRAGMGSSGNVKAGQISQLMTRPPGVTEVVNPIRASGGADREGLEQARENAPLALMALDRLISVQDYTYFTRTFAGIGKAAAALIPYNRRNIVYITIAGAGDIPIDKGSDLYRNLTKALHDLGDIGITVEVEPRVLVLLLIKAYVKLLDGYQWESVQPRIRAALYSAFGFDMRDLGRSVQQSEVISAIQSIEGVAYVDLEVLEGISGNTTPEELESLLSNLKEGDPRPYIRAEQAGIDPRGGLQPAQLVILSSDPGLADTLILQEVK